MLEFCELYLGDGLDSPRWAFTITTIRCQSKQNVEQIKKPTTAAVAKKKNEWLTTAPVVQMIIINKNSNKDK